MKIYSSHFSNWKYKISHFHFNFKKTSSWFCVPLSVTKSLTSGKPSIPSFAANLAAASLVHFNSSAASLFPEDQRWSSATWIIITYHILLICLNLVFLSHEPRSTFNFLCLAEIAPHWTCVSPAFLLVTCSPFGKSQASQENGNLTIWLTVLVHLTEKKSQA